MSQMASSTVIDKKKVLVAEDDFANQQVARLFLKKMGYEAEIAENGQQAIELANANQYALIFMDCQMPLVDGFEATRQIRQQSKNTQTPIIALTANLLRGTDSDCFDIGMNDILFKPVKMDNMQAMLNKWIKEHRT